jgi:hypothetical protein
MNRRLGGESLCGLIDAVRHLEEAWEVEREARSRGAAAF